MTSTLIARLRDDLAAANFFVDGLAGLWGEAAAAALHRGQRVPAQRAITADTPLGALATVFVLGLPVARHQLEVALPSLGTDGALGLGLVGEVPSDGFADGNGGGAGIRPLLDLRPHGFVDTHGVGSWWIASDLGELALGHAIPEGHVLGVGGASKTLSGLKLGEPVGSVLDLGTGCGIQALHASRHAKRVVATDISERALELAAFNAELNGVTSIEFRLGSLFEPVAGERFDHIVSNPPFVITPRIEGVPAYEYRDGGLVGDAIVEHVIRGVEEHLNPGGVAQLLGNWEYQGGDAFERLRRWLFGSGLDAWVVEREQQDAALYAETWIRDGGTTPGTPEFDRLYGSWLDDFAARGVEKVGFGYVTLRRPDATADAAASAGAPRLRRFERLDGALGHNLAGLGEHIAAALQAYDWQAGRSDDALARAYLTVASDVTEERHYWPGDEHPTVITLRQGGGFGRTYPVGTAVAAVVGACDGDLAVGAICAAIAQLLEVDEAELLAEVLPELRELIFAGFLHP